MVGRSEALPSVCDTALVDTLYAALAGSSVSAAGEGTLAVLLRSAGRTAPAVPPAVNAAVQVLRARSVRIAGLCASLGVERRDLSAQFRRHVGVGLKQYARLQRFERALTALRRVDAPGLANVAAESGYADQAHLTREFGQFAGFPPRAIHRIPGPTPRHVLHDELHDETFKTPAPGRC